MLNYNAILVRYGEIGLKSDRVRSRYERVLVDNIKAMLQLHEKEYSNVRRDWGRIFVHSSDESIADVVANVFGVVSTSPVISTESGLSAIAQLATDVGEAIVDRGESFAIRPHKAGKHPFSSEDIGRVCGAAVAERLKDRSVSVNLTSPDHEIFIEVRQDRAYVYYTIIKGVGGLPLGTQGKMVALISGGIDSPVAAWLMMRRGCEIIPVYYDTAPFSDDTMRTKVLRCIDVLQRWAPNHPMRVYEIPHGHNLQSIKERCPPKLTCVLCKRMMYLIAAEIAKKEKSHGIITGSSLGQVASQTSANLLAESIGINFPIYHPLIGYDKSEIVELAKKIGTFDISTSLGGECKAVPRYPATSAKIEDMCKAEARLDVLALIKKSLKDYFSICSSL
ncbi:MAG: tRNA uracil 4-sulfurtransferase ThiI [Methanocellales archaeon]|nr:tRNA uracil 4-sulfurtransferase ThiI [Methanocellales archaeon]